MYKFANKILACLPGNISYKYIENSKKFYLINPYFFRNEKSIASGFFLGQQIFDFLRIHTNFDIKCNILDVGCGDGRVGSAFARSEFSGNYFGFDINLKRIRKLQKLFKNKKEYYFKYVNIYHSYYNSLGGILPEDFIYPYDDNSMDLIFFNSIFSHMKFDIIKHYLGEAKRCLTKNGKIWATFYIMDEMYNPNYSNLKWNFNTKFDKGYTATPNNPEGCVAFDMNKINDLFNNLGLSIVKYIPEYWKSTRKTLDQHNQDIFVLKIKD